MPATKKEITAMKKYVQITNYIAAAQIYLRDNILLERPINQNDIKNRLLGHWGTCPGINFVYANVNRMIKNTNHDFIVVVGPGHGFPAIQANLFVEGSLTAVYPKKIPYSLSGLKEIISKFSVPYGYPSHPNPSFPGVILEGGELGYSLSVSYGSVQDNPDLITVCLVGDGEAETGPLAAAWQANKLLSPRSSGAVLPILHLNGYKISGPTLMGRMSNKELVHLFSGFGYEPFIVDSGKKEDTYKQMAETMDTCYRNIRAIQEKARSGQNVEKPKWPMIIMRTLKGWTGPKYCEGKKLEGNCLSHQVILGKAKTDIRHRQMLEEWLKGYKIEDLMNIKKDKIILDQDIQSLIPTKNKKTGLQKYVNGSMTRALRLPQLNKYSLKFTKRGNVCASSMKKAGEYLSRIFASNKKNIRLFSPDETYSNKLDDIFQVTARSWQWPIKSFDMDMSPDGRVMEMLSEHTLFGMLQGYTVTGRYGAFASYEAFTQVIASMVDQYAKYIKRYRKVKFRQAIPGLNIIVTSLLEHQIHNGFSHQNPSLMSSLLEKDGDLIFTYLPPDANCMLVTMEKILKSRNVINLVVSGKKNIPQWLTLPEAKKQMRDGIMTWEFASDRNPQVVLAASGDYATLESLAAIKIIKNLIPQTRLRFVSVSELTALCIGDPSVSIDSSHLDHFFTRDKGVVFNFHGYPQTIKKLLFDYSGSHRIKVNGYLEKGSITTAFDIEARNQTSRYHLVLDVADKLHLQGDISTAQQKQIKQEMKDRLKKHKQYIIKNDNDPAEILDWKWQD